MWRRPKLFPMELSLNHLGMQTINSVSWFPFHTMIFLPPQISIPLPLLSHSSQR
jgi:uncharacterized membrane protein